MRQVKVRAPATSRNVRQPVALLLFDVQCRLPCLTAKKWVAGVLGAVAALRHLLPATCSMLVMSPSMNVLVKGRGRER